MNTDFTSKKLTTERLTELISEHAGYESEARVPPSTLRMGELESALRELRALRKIVKLNEAQLLKGALRSSDETSRDPHTELKRLRKQMGEIAVLLLQNDRDEVLQWARGVKLHFPDGAPELMPDDECICPVKSGELCPVHHRRSEKAPETPDAPCCREGHNGGFVCTLPKGHAGRHEAWGEGLTQQRYLIVHWPSEKAAPKRAYYETHDPPHCPTCSCGLPPADACSCGRVELKDGYVRATCADGSVHTKGGCNSPSKAGDEP